MFSVHKKDIGLHTYIRTKKKPDRVLDTNTKKKKQKNIYQ